MTTTDAQPLLDLRQAVDRLLDGVPLATLRDAATRLSGAYRAGGGRGATSPIGSPVDRLAYVAARMPSTCEATRTVLAELRQRQPELKVESLLELGAGPAPGLWAAGNVFPGLTRATHLDADAPMEEVGRRLLAGTSLGARVRSTWHVRDATDPGDVGSHDLVLVAYLLGELTDRARARAVDAAWDAATGALVIVEPGTPAGAARVIDARARLLDRGARVAAPCPHEAPCPLPPDDWCHFAARVSRSRAHRGAKRAVLAYEDEKYAYLVVTRGPAAAAPARVLRRPVPGPRRIALTLCAADGLHAVQVTRRQGERYRAARKIRWGDVWDADPTDATSR